MSIIEPESGIWYALCWLAVLARLASRKLHLGTWKALQTDDYLIVVAMITDTILMAVMHTVVRTSSNLIAPGENVASFSQHEIDERILGSKLVLVVEQMQIITVWLIKACLLLMYSRVTSLLPQHKAVLGVAIYVAVGFVIMEILYFGVWCRPFQQYWAVPPNNPQCSAATHHLITNAVINISSDLMILAIPLPLLFKVKLPIKNKLILFGVFLVGTFTIVAAALNKYYSFSNPFGNQWTIWYLRESYTAILCANLPLTWPLLQRLFRLKNWSYHNSYGPQRYYGSRTHRSGALSAIKSNIPNQRLPSTQSSYKGNLRRTESEEQIYDAAPSLKIYQNTEITVLSTKATELEVLPSPSQVSINTKESKSDELSRA